MHPSVKERKMAYPVQTKTFHQLKTSQSEIKDAGGEFGKSVDEAAAGVVEQATDDLLNTDEVD